MDQPPTYSEVFRGQQPTAPLMIENSLVYDQPANNPGWGLSTNHQYPQYPVMAQPMVQQQVFQHQTVPQQTIVIINQQLNVGSDPVVMICPHCQQQSITEIDNVCTWRTHFLAALLCCLGWIPCAIIPYCVDCLKDTVHTCAKCRGYIGTYRRSQNGYRRNRF